MNPDGTLKGTGFTTAAAAPEEEEEEGKDPGKDARLTDEPNIQAGGIAEDPDTKVYSDYETIDDKEVVVGKRTRYRIWKEFENGTHSTFYVIA